MPFPLPVTPTTHARRQLYRTDGRDGARTSAQRVVRCLEDTRPRYTSDVYTLLFTLLRELLPTVLLLRLLLCLGRLHLQLLLVLLLLPLALLFLRLRQLALVPRGRTRRLVVRREGLQLRRVQELRGVVPLKHDAVHPVVC